MGTEHSTWVKPREELLLRKRLVGLFTEPKQWLAFLHHQVLFVRYRRFFGGMLNLSQDSG